MCAGQQVTEAVAAVEQAVLDEFHGQGRRQAADLRPHRRQRPAGGPAGCEVGEQRDDHEGVAGAAGASGASLQDQLEGEEQRLAGHEDPGRTAVGHRERSTEMFP
jgi:hypothetical protein